MEQDKTRSILCTALGGHAKFWLAFFYSRSVLRICTVLYSIRELYIIGFGHAQFSRKVPGRIVWLNSVGSHFFVLFALCHGTRMGTYTVLDYKSLSFDQLISAC